MGPLGDLEKKKLLYKALMETNYAFSVIPVGPFRDHHPLTGKKNIVFDFHEA